MSAPKGREQSRRLPPIHRLPTIHRRGLLRGFAGTAAFALTPRLARAVGPVSLGLNPLFLDSDIELLARLQDYLAGQLKRPVQLIKRRTYQEITAMLLSGQLDAAWICDDPYAQHRDRLTLLAVPLYRKQPLYQAYVIVNASSTAQGFDDIAGTIHAFSDPDSTSGYLVTRYQLALRKTTPNAFFRKNFFTYGHRNVLRAVATGLASSGSIDGYVWDVMGQREPELVNRTRVIYRSPHLGFPPIVSMKTAADKRVSDVLAAAFIDMANQPLGRAVLDILQLDGFMPGRPDLYDATADMLSVVQAQV